MLLFWLEEQTMANFSFPLAILGLLGCLASTSSDQNLTGCNPAFNPVALLSCCSLQSLDYKI